MIKKYSINLLIILLFPLNIFGQPAKDIIAFRLIDDLIYINIKINNTENLNFLFDTGSSTTVISPELGQKLKLQDGISGNSMGAGGMYETEIFKNQSVKLNSLLINNATLLKSGDPLESTVFGETLDGIIGFDILSRYVVEINFDNKLISLFDFDNYEPNQNDSSFTFKKFSNIPYLPFEVRFNGESYKGNYLIDSGAQLELLLTTTFFKKLEPLNEINNHYVLTKNIGLDQHPLELIIGKIDQINVFGQKYLQVPMVTSKADIAVFALDKFDGILGNGILKRFTCTFDYYRNILYVSPGKFLNTPFTVDCLGASFERNYELRKLIIEFIVAGSPAEKYKLIPGDEIIAMNKVSIKDISNKQMKSFLEADGQYLKLEILRDGKIILLDILLKALI